MDKFKSRRFILACFFSLMSTIMVFKGIMVGGTYVAVVTIIMGIYGGTDTYQQVKKDDISKSS